MLPPPKDSVGARILKKMGWRLGQGIGPRLTWRQRKLQDIQASTGPEVDVGTLLADEDAEEASKHTYAPRDTPVLVVNRKDNAHGLGYQPGMGLNDRLGVRGTDQPKGPNLSGAFRCREESISDLMKLHSGVWTWSIERCRRRRLGCL
jgi:G patch domain-containing protein 1